MSMADRDGFIWFDGKLLPWREVTVHGLTHSLHYGMGVFEGERAYNTPAGPAIFRLQEHTRRLFNSAKILQMDMPFGEAEINAATCEVIRANGLESAYIRPLAFYGAEGMGLSAKGLKTHVLIAAWPWGAYLGQEALERGIRVKVSSFNRHHVNIHMVKAKATGNYLNSMLAQREASAAGYDEALLLDREGYVAEGSGENIFMVRDGVLYTPTLTSALEGITRDTVMRLAGELGIRVVEKQLTRDEFYIADEAFFTGTAAEVTPIREIDGRVIGSGSRGPVTQRLQSLYFDQVTGKRKEHPEWLTYVNDVPAQRAAPL
ncbi:MAG: branched-chain amino acid transaminase [Pseudomonadota bacterium]